jgi:heme exporter protein C
MAFKYILFVWMCLVIVLGIGLPISENPQKWYELPYVQGLEDKARILFFHVPMAWTTSLAFIMSLVFGIRYLMTKNLDFDMKSSASAGLGLLFCILATITGSLWAKFNWGSFWNWDPRETSIFVLLLIYGAYFALRSAVEGDEKKANLSAVYAIIAGVTVPFFIFVMPRIVGGLHPNEAIVSQGKITMNTVMLIIFLCSLAGFTGLYLWLFNLKVRIDHMYRRKGE